MGHSIYVLFFWISFFLCIFSGCLLLFARSLARASLFLVVFLAGSSGVYLLLGSPFLSFLQFLIFLGGLLLFLRDSPKRKKEIFEMATLKTRLYLPAFFVGAMMMILFLWVIWESPWASPQISSLKVPSFSSISRGAFFLNNLFLPLILFSFLVFTALAGARYFYPKDLDKGKG